MNFAGTMELVVFHSSVLDLSPRCFTRQIITMASVNSPAQIQGRTAQLVKPKGSLAPAGIEARLVESKPSISVIAHETPRCSMEAGF